ncbi:MAG TPA: hypothetical protein VF484_02215, partial [Candidatus Limnocylindrales bacterium]
MPFQRFWASLSMGERIAVAGAALVLVIVDWLLGALLMVGGLSITTELGAAEIILLVFIRHARPSIAWPLPYPVLLVGFAVLVVVPTISFFLSTIVSFGQVGSGTDVLSDVLEWIGAGAVAFGAFQVWKS